MRMFHCALLETSIQCEEEKKRKEKNIEGLEANTLYAGAI